MLFRSDDMGYQPLPQKPRYDGPPRGGSSISRLFEPQSYDPNQSTYVPPQWGISAREAADALAHAFGGQRNDATLVLMRTIEQEIVIARTTPQEVGCVGYEEL